jgi:REP element-mobilizing transposase RayT
MKGIKKLGEERKKLGRHAWRPNFLSNLYKKKMPLKFKNHSPRAKWWDYSSTSTYFITICTKEKTEYFGSIINDEVILSPIGQIVYQEWLMGPQIRPDMSLKLYNFVIMPDHFHALLEIGSNEYNQQTNFISDPKGNFVSMNEFGPQSKNLGSIIRGFKSAVTVRAREIDHTFQWRKLYHDIIVKDEESFLKMQWYIKNNPKNWKGK